MSDFLNKEKEFKSEIQKLSSLSYESKTQISHISSKLKLYENSKCPTCSSDLSSAFHGEMKEGFLAALSIAETDYKNADIAMQSLKTKDKELEDEKRVLIERESKIKFNIGTISTQLRELQSGPKNDQLESIQKIVSNMESQIEESKKDKGINEERLNWNKIVEDILGEKGVKQMAIKTVLPSLNSEIYRMMIEMHLDYKVVFDEEFNSTITHLGQEVSIATLSRGEMKKADFVVLIAVIKLMKMRFPGVNILFLDELLDGVDSDGVNSILKILNKSTKEMGINALVVSHIHQFPNDTFDYKIEVDKKNNFSNLTVLPA